jgi:hypothetical protein
MVELGPYKKFTQKDIIFFVFLFVVCIAGSVGIFWFAVGINNGNVIMKNFLKALLDNAAGIIAALLLFNLFLAVYYSKRR